MQRAALLRRTGPTATRSAKWTPDQQRTTPQKSGALRSIRGTAAYPARSRVSLARRAC